MLSRFIFCVYFLLFATLSAGQNAAETWLECFPSERYSPLLKLSSETSFYEEILTPYLSDRGVETSQIEKIFEKDLYNIAQALTILFDEEELSLISDFLGEHSYLVESCKIKIDHVGREVYGPINFYFPLLEEIAPKINLAVTKQIVFPSTQVVKVLQEFDPEIKGVTIGRIYFQDLKTGKTKNIELFQPSLKDGSSPQTIDATQRRIALLTDNYNPTTETPIDHISIEVSSAEQVQAIHEKIHRFACATLRPNMKSVSYNPGDGSTQTKALIRDSAEAPFNKIVEFVHYQ